MSQNYYETLGVKKVASSDDIKGAFRKKAMEYHPDRNEGDVAAEEMFKKVNDAYSVLGDPEKRKMYDSGVDPNQNGPGPGGFGGFGGFNGNPNSFSDLFSKFNMGFGGHGPRTEDNRQQIINVNISISLYDSIFGVDKDIEFGYRPVCSECGGNGAKELETCKHCGGRGMVAEQRGNTQMIAPCPICRGTGKMMKDVCDKCGGTGHTETKTRKLIIKIKPGIKPGERLIMQGAGIPDKSGVFGPLVVNIDIIFPDKSSFSNEEKDILQKILNK
jgi:molecular chaperone DnaJ